MAEGNDYIEEQIDTCVHFAIVCEETQQWRDVFYTRFLNIMEGAPHKLARTEIIEILRKIVKEVSKRKKLSKDAQYNFAHRTNAIWKKAKGNYNLISFLITSPIMSASKTSACCGAFAAAWCMSSAC